MTGIKRTSMYSELEMKAILLVRALESAISVGTPVTTEVTLALSNFRMTQYATNKKLAQDVEALLELSDSLKFKIN